MTSPSGRLLRVAGTATAVAGLVGILRQRHEARQVAHGVRMPDGPDGARAPVRPYAPLPARIASWVPPRPRTTVGRVAAALWAAPLTAVGLAVSLTSGSVPRWDASRGCLVATGVGGPSSLALRTVGAGANTVGHVVLCRSATPSATLLDHEAVHVRQGERLGPLLVPAYLWANALHGYRDNPFEHAARAGARGA